MKDEAGEDSDCHLGSAQAPPSRAVHGMVLGVHDPSLSHEGFPWPWPPPRVAGATRLCCGSLLAVGQ